MTFTYDVSDTPSDLARVRFLIEDTVSPGLISDEEISMAIAENQSDYKKALVPCVNVIMGKLAKESGVELDWLKVDRVEALKHYKALKLELERTYSTSNRKITATVSNVSRSDYGN